jgi:hypothetical protein
MFARRHPKSAAIVFATILLSTATFASHAESTHAASSHAGGATLSAWFDLQRQVTDGSVDPYQHSQAAAMQAAAQAKQGNAVAASPAPTRESADEKVARR